MTIFIGESPLVRSRRTLTGIFDGQPAPRPRAAGNA
jgi:hypothetical protein